MRVIDIEDSARPCLANAQDLGLMSLALVGSARPEHRPSPPISIEPSRIAVRTRIPLVHTTFPGPEIGPLSRRHESNAAPSDKGGGVRCAADYRSGGSAHSLSNGWHRKSGSRSAS